MVTSTAGGLLGRPTVLLGVLFLAPEMVAAPGHHATFTVGVGLLDALRHEASTEYSLDYRFPTSSRVQGRLIGAWSTGGSQLFGAGLLLRTKLDGRWEMAIGFAPAYYEPKNGPPLGFSLQFLSNLEVSRLMGSGYRVGVSFEHTSNGSFGDANPGAETVRLFWAVPISR